MEPELSFLFSQYFTIFPYSEPHEFGPDFAISIYLSGLVTAVAVFRNLNTIPFCLTLRRLMSYIYGASILDVSRSHTTTQHSR